ncbi:ArsR family transcriptional regulator [Bradyrhizobium liaoningense]|uniref:ArsR family transcriptional regulator n=1 Tax=Bradyrhizobium liaoningense TaxID=43992 RepID=UPI001BAC96A5|nr:ArsR family transcriptional regulator [Bradyrhizobium liaoningense]MBR0714047.1 ArsR family transcriptional regulator [Bradyrhizobium liaoningense]
MNEQFHGEHYGPSSSSGNSNAGFRCSTLAEVHDVFRRWLGDDYDMDSLDAVLAVAASERLPGDPAWLLVISGSGNAKTETVQAVAGLGAHIISTIASDGALLSASPKRQKAKDATGGLLRVIGKRGILVIKDVTSILSTAREIRGAILAALREIHDGRWVRNVGSDGGQTLIWEGRIVVIGACTTAWDATHSVVAAMGDRFVTIRPDSRKGRLNNGLRAMRNTGSETAMRHDMAEAVAGLVGNIDVDKPYCLTADDETKIVAAAELVTLARTGVETDYRGDVLDAHDPEAPTRLAKQLTQIMRGAMAIGMSHGNALRLVIRCARDSMPQLRLAVLCDVAKHPDSPVIEIRRRLQKPRTTIDRTLQALHILGLLVCREEERARGGQIVQVRFYKLADDISIDPITVPVRKSK